MMEAGRPGELHKKRLSRFDRRNIFKRHDLRGSNALCNNCGYSLNKHDGREGYRDV